MCSMNKVAVVWREEGRPQLVEAVLVVSHALTSTLQESGDVEACVGTKRLKWLPGGSDERVLLICQARGFPVRLLVSMNPLSERGETFLKTLNRLTSTGNYFSCETGRKPEEM